MDKIIKEFRQLAIERWENLLGKNGTAKRANHCFDRQCRILDELKNQNKLSEFAELLKDPDDAVVSDVGAFLLKEHYEGAKEALEVIAKKRDLMGFNAEMCLQELS